MTRAKTRIRLVAHLCAAVDRATPTRIADQLKTELANNYAGCLSLAGGVRQNLRWEAHQVIAAIARDSSAEIEDGGDLHRLLRDGRFVGKSHRFLSDHLIWRYAVPVKRKA